MTESVTLNGYQLKHALALAWPDGDADHDQADTRVTIERMPQFTAMDEDGLAEIMPPGLYLKYDEYPEFGIHPLTEFPAGGAALAKVMRRHGKMNRWMLSYLAFMVGLNLASLSASLARPVPDWSSAAVQGGLAIMFAAMWEYSRRREGANV